MKFLEHKGFIQKTIIAILCVTLFNFIAPNYMCLVSNAAPEQDFGQGQIQSIEGNGSSASTAGGSAIQSNGGNDSSSTEADDSDPFDSVGDFFANAGGILLSPFTALINFFADTIASAVQSFMMGNAEAVMTPAVDHYAQTDVNSAENADVRITKKYNIGATFYPNFTFSCEEIFANKVPMLDVNFLNPSVTNLGDTEVDKSKNVAAHLQSIIKAWYRVLRMIAIVGLLSVLIYIGIRIMIDSNLDNKAKYKQRLLDWLVAFVILFSMQYIMSFTLAISEELTDLFTGKDEETRSIVVYYQPSGKYFKTNLIGLARFKIQNDNVFSKLSYQVVYIALLVFTVKFAFVYLKRVVNMAFLTIISPIIALMYPIDKIQDGKAQGFQTWLKEYIFNALLQPFHYLLYTVLVTSSISLAANNPIYAIAALLFMTQAEKFLKKIFGFDKASNGMVGGMSSFATGAIASSIVSNAKKGGILGKERGPQSVDELAKKRMPTTRKDTDIDGLPVPDSLGDGANPNLNPPLQGNQENLEDELERERAEEVQRMMREQQAREQQEQQRMAQEQRAREMEEQQAALPGEVQGINGGQQQDFNTTADGQSDTQPGTNTPPLNGDASDGNTSDSGSTNNVTNGSQSLQSMNLANSLENRKVTPDKKAGRKKILKHVAKPIWDTDKSTTDNLKRWGKRYVKAGMGLTTLAAYTGATLTDGKITAAEEVAAFAAGVKGGGIAFDNADKTIGNYRNAYREGAYGVDEAAAQQYQKQWKNNQEVKDFYHDNYADNADQYKNIASEELLTRGVKSLDEQKQCLKYADAVADERYKEWENNEKGVIRQEHQDYSDAQIENEFENRKKSQAQEIRDTLGKDGKKLSDDQAIHRAMMADATKEAASVLKFRKRAAGKDALLDGDRKNAFIKQQVKELKAKPEHQGKSDKELERYVASAYDRVDRFDALNKI